MRIPRFSVPLVVVVALVAGCGDDDGGGDARADAGVSETTDETTRDTAGSVLDDDVAAVVDGAEIGAARLDEHVEAFAENPQFAEQLEGDGGEAARAQLRAQVLSSMILTEVVSAGAEELDRPVTDEDVDAARQELEERLGGPDAFEAAVEQQGLTESLLEMELEGLAAMNNVRAALDEEAGDEGREGPPPGAEELSPSEQRAQQFLGELLAGTEITVNPAFGEWNAQAAQVVPAGGAPTIGQPGG